MSAFPEQTDQGWRRRVRSRVLRWYGQNGRKLPWRESADPYRIWISEIMLQQTTVATVVPYFERFLERFPTVQSLAEGSEEDALKLWEGLGYYSRARNLRKAAGVIVNELGGQFPQTADELRELPGIGPYTAGAIASFAFEQPSGIVEANTLRLYSRLIELDIDPRSSKGQKTLWQFADWIVARKRPGDFNQAVMDIGSQICHPVKPKCTSCPLMPSCGAYENGRQDEIPLAKKKTEITDVTEVSVAIHKGGKFLLRQRTENERWAGLWDFVRFEIDEPTATKLGRFPRASASKQQQPSLFDDADLAPLPVNISDRSQKLTGLKTDAFRPVVEVQHAVTRYRIRLLCLIADAEEGRLLSHSGYQWFSRKQLNDLPLSKTGRMLADRL